MEPLGSLALLVLLVPGITLLMALRIFYRKQVVTSNVTRMSLSLAAWFLILLAGIGAGLGSLSFLSGTYLPLVFIGLLMLVDRYRQGEHHALLHSLAFSAEKGVPLQEAARAFAQENAGDSSARAMDLAERIEAGSTLAAASRHARLRLSTPMRLAVNLSDVLVARGLALRTQLQWGNDADSALRMILNRLLYLFLLFHVLILIATFVMIKIVPVYQKMFEEFGLLLPRPTEWLITLSKTIINSGMWILLIPLAALSVCGLFLGVFFYTGWYDLPIFRFLNVFEKKIPESHAEADDFRLMDLAFVTRMFVWRYDASLVLRSLAMLMHQQMPLPQALVLLANVYPRGNVRRRLTNAAREIELGGDWKQALRRQWLLGRTEQALLASAERVGNLPWALEEMGDAVMRRMTYRLTVIYQIIFPILLFAFAAFVGFFCLALMMPLISLIEGLL